MAKFIFILWTVLVFSSQCVWKPEIVYSWIKGRLWKHTRRQGKENNWIIMLDFSTDIMNWVCSVNKWMPLWLWKSKLSTYRGLSSKTHRKSKWKKIFWQVSQFYCMDGPITDFYRHGDGPTCLFACLTTSGRASNETMSWIQSWGIGSRTVWGAIWQHRIGPLTAVRVPSPSP